MWGRRQGAEHHCGNEGDEEGGQHRCRNRVTGGAAKYQCGPEEGTSEHTPPTQGPC